MTTITTGLRALFALIIAMTATFALAGGGPVATMAEVVEGLNHYPSEEQKASLAAIAGDADNSAAIQTIAQSIHDMQHKVSADHAAQLEAIANDEANPEDVRKLADVVRHIEHKPSAEAVETLKSLK